jgi:beta-fructofuranosidase
MRIKGTIARDTGGNSIIKTRFVAMGITGKEDIDVPAGDIIDDYNGKEVEIRIQELKDGKAVLEKNETQEVIHDQVKDARMLRERLLGDEFRPGYHFAIPEDNGMPGDPNGAFFANGRYHLMYLYDRRDVGFCWGHISSIDLVHWRHHPDAIGPGDGDQGCFSGGGFLDDDGTAYVSYWKLVDDKGIGIASSKGPNYDTWEKLPAPAIPATSFGIWEKKGKDGKLQVLACADPSNIWKKDGAYYMQAGNLLVLEKFGRDAKNPQYARMRGDWVDLYRSTDMKI